MECTPQGPHCDECPMNYRCKSYRTAGGAERNTRVGKPIPRCTSAVGILCEDGQVFIQRRPAGKKLAGLWEFPGGKRERGETPKQTVHRELREELGVEVEVGEKLATVRHSCARLKLTLHAYLCRHSEGDIRPVAADAWKWTPIGNLDEYEFPEANREILDALESLEATAHGRR